MEEIAPGPIRLWASDWGYSEMRVLLKKKQQKQQRKRKAEGEEKSTTVVESQSFRLCASGCTMSGRYSKDKPELQRRHPFLSVI
jgi:hypothetical protein